MTQRVKNGHGRGLFMKEPAHDVRCSIVTALRWATLFGVGSLLILQERTSDFVRQAVERGKEAEDEGKKLVQEMRAERKKREPQRIDALDIRISAALKRLNIPTQEEIRELSQQITELSKHIDALKAAR
jgi:polyhydroxyalkanoate synthesis regulator phasin